MSSKKFPQWTFHEIAILKASFRCKKDLGLVVEALARAGYQRPKGGCYWQARKHGLWSLGRNKRPLLEPSRKAWKDAAWDASITHRVSLKAILCGARKPRKVIDARWDAWHAVLRDPEISVAGLARISGFDRTAIGHSLVVRGVSRPT